MITVLVLLKIILLTNVLFCGFNEIIADLLASVDSNSNSNSSNSNSNNSSNSNSNSNKDMNIYVDILIVTVAVGYFC